RRRRAISRKHRTPRIDLQELVRLNVAFVNPAWRDEQTHWVCGVDRAEVAARTHTPAPPIEAVNRVGKEFSGRCHTFQHPNHLCPARAVAPAWRPHSRRQHPQPMASTLPIVPKSHSTRQEGSGAERPSWNI